MENSIELKSISELMENNFFIPAYQRGYRWTRKQVIDLLDDIWNFIKLDNKPNEWYCLQPVVVKSKENNLWEVIDGQQRLTTIFLILKYLKDRIDSDRKTFEIEYETRTESKEFLQNIKTQNETESSSNIDFRYMQIAFNEIVAWFKLKSEKYKSVSNEFITPFLDKTKVIWYETVSSQDGRDIFSRINMGKIPLTNAELIKALFLRASNFGSGDEENKEKEERTRLKQLEIAGEWDDIEYSLQNDELWFFLNEEDEAKRETRIEFILELITGLSSYNDGDYTFRQYHGKFEQNQDFTENWKEVKRYFQTIQDWFENRELYHKIGFLIACLGISHKKQKDAFFLEANKLVAGFIEDSVDKHGKGITKIDFLKNIDQAISKQVGDIQFEDLEYGKHDTVIRKILLLHNIQTMLNNKKENSRFPFNRYKMEDWDIEHIHAVAADVPDTEQRQKDWLENAKKFIDPDEMELINKIAIYSKETFNPLFVEILNYFSENNHHEDINNLSNLVLLDKGTNRGYKNAIFPVKRSTIIEREKMGTFVPICTKNVFMKYYSPKIEQMTLWGETDKEKYLEDIHNVLNNFLYPQG